MTDRISANNNFYSNSQRQGSKS